MNYKSLLIKIFLSLALLTAVAMQVDYAQIKSIAQNIHPVSWVYAMIFMLLQITGLAVRWTLLLNAGKRKNMRFATAIKITAISSLANYVFITSLGGIIARITLSMTHGFPFVKAMAATIIDRGMPLLALVILGMIFLPIFGHEFHPAFLNEKTMAILLALAALGMFVLLFLYKKRRAIIFYNRKITVCVKYLRSLLSSPALLIEIVCVSLVTQIMYFAAVYSVMHSLGGNFTFIQFMVVMPIITLAASLPIGYGGWGIREGAFMFGLQLINIPVEAAFMASVQIGVISMITAAVAGIPAFIDDETQRAIKDWKNRKIRPSHAPQT